jgi:very-short-patch-repair endonuclease
MPTDAERKLWQILRDRQLAGFKFRRQFLVDRFILDFYCVRAKLAIELDGGQHAEPQAAEYDAQRTDRLRALGVHVLRFWDHEVLKNPEVVMQEIHRHLTESRPSPQPSPGVPGEGDCAGRCLAMRICTDAAGEIC